ncbi:MAG: cell division protein FtsQ/DivIB, partial [Coriobacteriales bacterium]|nr:cell division protein FtsQ/DivIB [Coriobacteriales bacterium]
MGSDTVWIEPFPVETKATESFNDSALTTAQEKGLILICNVPLTVSPVAGQLATDECIRAVSWFYDQLTPEFRDQVVCYSASSDDDISCILNNGVEVSFGQVSNVDTKESVARRILDEFGGQVTYINVRVPTHPTYRRVNSTYVREGSGATGSLLDQEDTVQ